MPARRITEEIKDGTVVVFMKCGSLRPPAVGRFIIGFGQGEIEAVSDVARHGLVRCIGVAASDRGTDGFVFGLGGLKNVESEAVAIRLEDPREDVGISDYFEHSAIS